MRKLIYVLILLYSLINLACCGTITGVRHFEYGALKLDMATGFGISADAQNYDHVRDTKGINTNKETW